MFQFAVISESQTFAVIVRFICDGVRYKRVIAQRSAFYADFLNTVAGTMIWPARGVLQAVLATFYVLGRRVAAGGLSRVDYWDWKTHYRKSSGLRTAQAIAPPPRRLLAVPKF